MTKQDIDKKNKILIEKDVVRDEWKKRYVQETRDEIRGRRQKFFIDAWNEDFPEYNYINYFALLELANRSEKVGRWMAEKSAEFSALLTFPEWAAEGTSEEDRIILQDTFSNINKANREASELKMGLARKVKSLTKEIDDLHEANLAKAYKGNISAFILTFPKNQLPVHLMLSLIKYTDEYEEWSKTASKDAKQDRVTPSDYENNLIDAFRKSLWIKYREGADIQEELKNQGVDFFIPTKSVAPDHLSRITKVIG